MKLQELNQNELTEINGGSLLGLPISGSLSGGLSIGGLLSLGISNTATGGLAISAVTGNLSSLLGSGLNLGGLNLGGLTGLLSGL
ncbi:hypothetical protein [Pedobacter sp. L105]|uniref:hypothetical protein n=1 Tax=Pedobacter sp. L105 TaxID=1641871 RepID=UPI00131DBFFB|nr:hypothetical protein [Pedobacter sp. L105]